jgi:hypothetical protein
MQHALNASRSEFQQLQQRTVEVQGYLQHLKSRQDLLETTAGAAAPVAAAPVAARAPAHPPGWR